MGVGVDKNISLGLFNVGHHNKPILVCEIISNFEHIKNKHKFWKDRQLISQVVRQIISGYSPGQNDKVTDQFIISQVITQELSKYGWNIRSDYVGSDTVCPDISNLDDPEDAVLKDSNFQLAFFSSNEGKYTSYIIFQDVSISG